MRFEDLELERHLVDLAPGGARKRLDDLWQRYQPKGTYHAQLHYHARGSEADPLELTLDACYPCQFIWFDAKELERFSPVRQRTERGPEELSPKARMALAEFQAALNEDTATAATPELQRALARSPLAWLLAWLFGLLD